ncbi:hypothetical protein MAGR_20380 [Mycolicibacterium agri]|uniref:Uncharacterized protein n=1 Tax=Mycolicibacterium agri TaxID=36811 RepID=A0A7I9VZX7_MYCAG|nr:hypothetical protein MAGR_20380 [Mycolicibacterium agri]
MKTVFTLGLKTADPGVDAFTRDPHRFRDMGFGPASLIPAHYQQPAVKRRTGITVGHENLRTVVDLDKPHPTRRFSSHQANTPATNVLSQYN